MNERLESAEWHDGLFIFVYHKTVLFDVPCVVSGDTGLGDLGELHCSRDTSLAQSVLVLLQHLPQSMEWNRFS